MLVPFFSTVNLVDSLLLFPHLTNKERLAPILGDLFLPGYLLGPLRANVGSVPKFAAVSVVGVIVTVLMLC